MKQLLSLILLISLNALADEPVITASVDEEQKNHQQCQEWAVMDSVMEEDQDAYMDECMMNLNYQEPDFIEEPDIYGDSSNISPDYH